MARAPRRAPRRMGTLFLATDFSPGARHAERRLLLLPAAEGATVHLLHVVAGARSGSERRRAVADAEERLGRVASRLSRRALALGAPEPALELHVAAGAPYVEIVRRSRAAGADLVVLGRHGHRSAGALVLGTTAGRVVRTGDVPVLVVGAPPAGPYRRLLVGVDLEDASIPLVALAGRLAGRGAEALLAHACHPAALGRLIAAAGSRRERAEDRRSVGREAADRMRALVAAAGRRAPGLALRPLVFHGDARRVLPLEAARRRADLLVVGTHGRTGLSHALLGSVAERVLAAAPCDVAVARPARFTFQLP